MANDPEATQEQVRELLGYTVDDLGSLAASTARLSETDPQSAQQIAAQALGAIADSSVRFAAILTGDVAIISTPLIAKSVRSTSSPIVRNEETDQPEATEKLTVASEKVGALAEDPSAKKSIKQIRALKQRISESRWGIGNIEDLERACRLIYDLDMDGYLEEAYQVPLALPNTTDFKPFQLVLNGERIACTEGSGCPATPSNRLLMLNLMAMGTYFNGVKSSVGRELLGKPLSAALHGGFYNTSYGTTDIVKTRGSKQNLTYTLRPEWRAEGVLGYTPS